MPPPTAADSFVESLQEVAQWDAIIGIVVAVIMFIVLVVIGTNMIMNKKNEGLGAFLIIIAFLGVLFAIIWYQIVQNNKSLGAAMITAYGGALKRQKRVMEVASEKLNFYT
jgi:Na+/citrate or Na+/malate symporter